MRRRVVRGSRSGEIRLTFVVNKTESARWLHFEPLRSNLVFHSDQGWGAFLDFPISGRDFRVAPIIAIDNGDDLIEEYSGFGLRFESRKLGTERLGASFEWSTFDQTWRSATLDALALNPRIPGAYDDRSTVTPLVRFAVTPQLRVGGGVSITELEPLSGVPDSQMANAAIASIGYDDRWEQGDASHDVGAEFIVRGGLGDARERLRLHALLRTGRISVSLGATHRVACRGWRAASAATRRSSSGSRSATRERCAAGTSTTSRRPAAIACSTRHWNIDIEVWRSFSTPDPCGTTASTRACASRRESACTPGPFFMTVGFPLNTDEVRAVFTTGVRFGGIGIRKD